MKTYNLTEKEKSFLTTMAENNACCANSWEELYGDNLSCLNFKDLVECTSLNKNQVAGLVSSLEDKGVIWIEDRSDPQPMFNEPRLYWIGNDFLEANSTNTENFSL